MNNPLKSITVVGDITHIKELSYKLCPDYFDINSGVWEVALSDIALSFTGSGVLFDSVYEVSSNLVQGFYYPEKKTLTKNNVILGRFQVFSDRLKLLANFGSPKWFVVNNQPSEIKLFFKRWPEKKSLSEPGFQVSVNLLLRRVL